MGVEGSKITPRKLHSTSPHTNRDMTVATAPSPTLNQIEFHLVQNQKENCHHDPIPFNVKGNGNIVFSV